MGFSGASTNSKWSIVYNGGITNISVNQAKNGTTWLLLASGLNCLAGTNGYVSLSNNSGEATNRIVLADGVRFTSSTPPFFINQPQSQTVTAGARAVFSVILSGTVPIGYQWQFNGTNLPNAAASSLTILYADSANAGLYSVLASNVISTAVSSNALLTISPPSSPTLLPLSFSTNGQFLLQLQGDSGVTFTIESSTNLVKWIALTNILNSTGSVSLGISVTNQPYQFYRAHWFSPFW